MTLYIFCFFFFCVNFIPLEQFFFILFAVYVYYYYYPTNPSSREGRVEVPKLQDGVVGRRDSVCDLMLAGILYNPGPGDADFLFKLGLADVP
mmetsp:Transcript_5475/g.7116  ORF Transcript_5475/g.7116 Transcript_5475/m.7116 type:complete len:92 (-) Transcript_5475:720-995(-)